MQKIDILVHGKPVKQIAHNGRIFIVAKHGTPYEIRLKNDSTHRILGVASVDGLNVISGEASQADGAGYIINGYGSYTIRGFRTSNEEVHPFIFSSKGKSYANKSDNGDVRDCGVIGVAFHAEQYQPIRYTTYFENRPYPLAGGLTHTGWDSYPITCNLSQSSGNSYSSVSGSIRATNSTTLDMGTQFADESVTDRVVDSEFKIGYEIKRVEIFYASRSVLASMGVPVYQSKQVAFPSAFKGFCKPPRN